MRLDTDRKAMNRFQWGALALAVTAALFAACTPAPPPCDPDFDECDGGTPPPPDVCNDRNEAMTNPDCALPACPKPDGGGGTYKQAFISFSGDQDFYLLKTGTLTPRSLVHVQGGYG